MIRTRFNWLFPVIPLLMGIGAAIACFSAAGATPGFFFGGVFFAAMLVPPMALAGSSLFMRAINVLAIVIGIGAVWLFKGVNEAATLPQCLNCLLVLACFAICLGSVASLLQSLRVNPFVASAMTVLLAITWLTWPIWLAPLLDGPKGDALAHWLVPAHPLLTINGLLINPDLPPDNWNERSIAYHLTNLGNSVPFAMPTSAWMTTIVHLGIAALCLWVCKRRAVGSRQ